MKKTAVKKPLYDIVLFYKYVSVHNPEILKNKQFALCQRLGLRGRIILSHEGINGTLEGLHSAVQKYIASIKTDPRFSDIVFKHSKGTGDAFPRLSIKVRNEIVTFGVPIVTKKRGVYIAPKELHSWFQKNEDMIILDIRNTYETRAGYFRNSLTPEISNFRDVPKLADNLKHHKDKKLVMVCTGGIRCEKASKYFKQRGYKNVYQLEGGIATYMKKYPGQDFLGSLYVFDNRILMQTEGEGYSIVGKCAACGTISERYTNCAYDPCHVHFICCEKCETESGGYCSRKCKAEANIANKCQTGAFQ